MVIITAERKMSLQTGCYTSLLLGLSELKLHVDAAGGKFSEMTLTQTLRSQTLLLSSAVLTSFIQSPS